MPALSIVRPVEPALGAERERVVEPAHLAMHDPLRREHLRPMVHPMARDLDTASRPIAHTGGSNRIASRIAAVVNGSLP